MCYLLAWKHDPKALGAHLWRQAFFLSFLTPILCTICSCILIANTEQTGMDFRGGVTFGKSFVISNTVYSIQKRPVTNRGNDYLKCRIAP